MLLSSALNSFSHSSRNVQKNFSGGVFDAVNQMFSNTGGMLTTFSVSCDKIMKAASDCDDRVKKLLPKGGVEIAEDLRNLEREIGLPESAGTIASLSTAAKPSFATPHPSYAASSSGSLPTTPSHRSSSLGTTTRTAPAPISRTVPASAASVHPASAKPMTPSASITTTPVAAMTASITTTSPTHDSGASALWKNYQESFEIYRKKMLSALRSCGIAYVKVKEVAEALDVALRQVSNLNALLGRKFDVDEFNRRASAVKELDSVRQECRDDTSDCVNSEKDFLSDLDVSFRQNIAMARNRLKDIETKLGRRPGWMKSRLALIDEIDQWYQGVANQVNSNLQQNKENISRLNDVDSKLTRMANSLREAKKGEDDRRSSIQSSHNEANEALHKAQSAHIEIVPKSRLLFTLRMAGSRYVVSPSKGDALNEEHGMLGAYLGQLESAAARLTALQKTTERLTASDINSTDTFPSFIIADACAFVIGGRTYYVPIPTAFPFSKPRRFADASEVAPFLLRLLCALPAGSVQITIVDQAAGGANGSVFNGLKSSMGTFRLVPRIDELHSVLKEHGDYIADLASSGKFGATDRTWAEYNSHHPKNPLPCKILVVYSFRGWDWQDVNELGNLIVNGATSGVNVIFSEDGIAELDDRLRVQVESWTVARNPVDASKWAKEGASLSLQHIPMRMPPNTTVGQICNAYIDCLEKRAVRAAHVFNDLFDGVPQWSASSIDGLETVIGWDESGNPVNIRFVEYPAHALIGGVSGGGKSNLIHVMICSLCHRYSPDELQICLLDMKNGDEAFRYLDAKGKAWLPHAKAILASTSPHFASKYLDEMMAEMNRRSSVFKSARATKIGEWRRKTGKKMPRILFIADEFTHIFDNPDLAKETSTKLGILLQQGRSYGIHILLATQSTDALTTSNAGVILSQTPIRLALPHAPGVLATGNNADRSLNKPQCILNESSGEDGKNRIFVHPLFDNEGKSLGDVDLFHKSMDMAKLAFKGGPLPTCKVVDSVSLLPVPAWDEFRKLLGPEPGGVRPSASLLLGRADDFDSTPYILRLYGDAYRDHLFIASEKDPIGRTGIWDGLRRSVVFSLASLSDKHVLFYDPLREKPFSSKGFTVLYRDNSADQVKSELEILRDSTARHRVLVVNNFDAAGDVFYRADAYGDPEPDTALGILYSALRPPKKFTVILFARDVTAALDILGDAGWRNISHHIAFGYDGTDTLREIIKGTEMLDRPGESVFHSGPGVHGGYETFLPFVTSGQGVAH